MITRLRTLWATIAPVAQPLIASAAIGWGIATLGKIAEERRGIVDQLGAIAAGRVAELNQLHDDITEASQVYLDYSSRLRQLRAQLADIDGGQEERVDEGTRDDQAPPVAAGPALPRTEDERDRLVAAGFMCGCCNAATTPDGGGQHAGDCPHIGGSLGHAWGCSGRTVDPADAQAALP